MSRFVLRRMGQALVTLLILIGVVFTLSRMSGDPLDLMLPTEAPQELRERMEHQLGLDRPLPTQFIFYLRDVVTGDFGVSIRHRSPVVGLFIDRFPNSLRLIVPAFITAWLVAVPLAVISAATSSRRLDRALTMFATLALATPIFWLGIIFVLIFSVSLGVLPSSRMGGLDHYILPVVTLALFLTAGIMRLVRSSMLDSLGAEYIKLARLKGLSERVVVWKHALRNSLTAGLSFLGVYFSTLIAGSIVIETVFAWPGSGRLLYDAIVARDYPLVQGIILLTAALIMAVNFMFDVLHAYLDPRIRLD